MKLTNKIGLPEALVNAVRNDGYSRGAADISVTQLIDSPFIRHLRQQHASELTEDVSDRIWSLMGQSIHAILERANLSGLVEQRLFADVAGKKLSGQFDHLENGVLTDWKMTSVWAVVYGKPDWGKQLNVLAYLCRLKGLTVNSLQIVAILRDWSKSKAGKEDNYPDTQVVTIPITLWTPERQEEYVLERINAHFHDGTPPCTDDERWVKPGKFAVMKKGRKSALRLLDSKEEAEKWVVENGEGTEIVERPATFNRCELFCNVNQFCPVWQQVMSARAK